jgi:hypothetical protein
MMRGLILGILALQIFACKSLKSGNAPDTNAAANNYMKGTILKDDNCKYLIIQSISKEGDTLRLLAVSGLSGKEKPGSQISFEYLGLRMPQPDGCRGIPAAITLK